MRRKPQTATILTTHDGADLDGYASMVGLSLLYPNARLALPQSLQERVRQVVHDFAHPPLVERPEDLHAGDVARLVLTDTPVPRRAGAWAERLARQVETVIYDHHAPKGKRPPNRRYVYGAVGSTCTLVVEALRDADICPPEGHATLLLAGLYEDTGQLGFRSVKPRDFAAAHQLSLWGARTEGAGEILERLWSERQVEAYDAMRESCRTVSWGNLRAAVARVEFPFFVADLSEVVSRLRPPGADAIFVLAAVPRKVFVIARALRSGVDVSAPIRALGGGGHAEAASAVLREGNLSSAENRLRSALRKASPRVKTAAELMTPTVVAVDASERLTDAHKKFSIHRVGSLIVLRRGKVAGILDHAVLSACLSHGMQDEPIEPYMRTPVRYVDPKASLDDLRVRLGGDAERIFVVGTETRPLGVVTRRDILRGLYAENLPGLERGPGEADENVAERLDSALGDVAAHLKSLSIDGLYLVGGCVRDLLLDRKPQDWDLVVEGDIEPVLERWASAGAKVKRHGRFGTASVSFDDGLRFDLASARRETYLRPGALPDVQPASLEEDLYRRDFTVNAMAISVGPNDYGRLVDRFRGRDDLNAGLVRVLHGLSFVDDPTRAFRGLRLAVRFDFELSGDTRKLLDRAVALDVVSESEGSRLRREMVLAFREDEPLAVLRAFDDAGLLIACVSNFKLQPAEPYLHRMTEWTTWYHLQFGRRAPIEETLWLGALTLGTRGSGGASGKRILGGFKVSSREIDVWKALRRQAGRIVSKAQSAKGWKPSRWENELRGYDDAVLLLWATLDPSARSIVVAHMTEWRTVTPAVTGHDLAALGIKRGPEMGEWTRRVRAALLDGELPPDREAQLAFIRAKLEIRD